MSGPSIDILGSYPPFSARFQAAEFLRHPGPQALELSMAYNEKRLVLAALCLVDPQHREVYRPLTSKLNFERSFPYWTVQQVLARP